MTWLLPALLAVAAPAAERPVLHLAYFVPADRQPLPGYAERLDRIMGEVRDFYAREMARHGYGPLTFEIARRADGQPLIHLVNAREPAAAYGRNAAGKVAGEVRPVLQAAGLNPDRCHVIIFQVLLEWVDGRAIEIGPYVGGGGPVAGTCWVYDDPLLNPANLGSREPGGYYGRPCSIGQFNTHYLGGVAHELGHALGLPHDKEPGAGPGVPRSLMGSGNHAYGQERRGEGPGTVLSPASAMILARHPLFTGETSVGGPGRAELDGLEYQFAEGRLTITGQSRATPAAYGVIAYQDPAEPAADYDAVAWTAPVTDDGRFTIAVGEFRPGPAELRLRVCLANGETRLWRYDLQIAPTGQPDLAPLRRASLLAPAVRAYLRRDRPGLGTAAEQARRAAPEDTELARRLRLLERLLQPVTPVAPADLPETTREVGVSTLAFAAEAVGWGAPLRDQVLPERGEPFLSLAGTVYERGLWAHAPSRYEVALAGQWRRLTSGYGLQDNASGSVVFVVRADGRELFRSTLITDHLRRELDLDVTGARQLELVVEDGGNGANSDWGIWVEPVLTR